MNTYNNINKPQNVQYEFNFIFSFVNKDFYK